MALGDAGDYYKNSKLIQPNSYGYLFANLNEKAQVQSKMSFSMWKSMLKVAICSDFTRTEDGIAWDDKMSSTIYLNFNKANILLNLLVNYKNDKTGIMNGRIVESGKSFIGVYNGTNFNIGEDQTIIRIVQFADGERKTILRQSAYQLKTGVYYGKSSDEQTMSVEYDENACYKENELDLLIYQLQTFVQAMSNSFAYAETENRAYSDSLNKLVQQEIMRKIGGTMPTNLK